MIRAQAGCCEEAALGMGAAYLPCNKPASKVVDVNRPDSSEGPYLMCDMCADHSVRNRGMKVVRIYVETEHGMSAKNPTCINLQMSQDGTLLVSPAMAAVFKNQVVLFIRSRGDIWDVRTRDRVDEGNRAL